MTAGPPVREGALPSIFAHTAVLDDVKEPVTIYGAEWCGPCHQAAAFLTRRGVPFVQRNVDKDSDAAREMNDKLDSAGLSGGAIPVIDVNGLILVGFSARAVDRALARPM
jgi:glutaredoxin